MNWSKDWSFHWKDKCVAPERYPEIAEMLTPSKGFYSGWTKGHHTQKKGKLNISIRCTRLTFWTPLFSFATNHFQKDKFVSATIIIGSIPKSSNLYLLHWKIHLGLRIIIYAQLFPSFDFSFDITSWFKAWCTINFLQMCSNS